jgi:hypothetical protein
MATQKSKHEIHKMAVLMAMQKLRDENVIAILTSAQSKSSPEDDTPDLVVYGENNTRLLIKVKVDSNKPGVWGKEGKLGYGLSWIVNKPSSDKSFYYCLLHKEENDKNSQYFIIPASVVHKYMTDSAKYQDISIKLFLLSTDEDPESLHVDTPLSADYVNRWDFLQ